MTDPPNPLGLSKRMKVTFADAELEAKEGLYEIGAVATVRVQLSRQRDMESHGDNPHHSVSLRGATDGSRTSPGPTYPDQPHLPARPDGAVLPREGDQRRHRR